MLIIFNQDTLAREILNRVDASSYGVKGRKGSGGKSRPYSVTATESGGIDLQSTQYVFIFLYIYIFVL
jgi:hypothetical protein